MKQVKISQVDAVFANSLYPIEFLFFYLPAFDTKRLSGALRKLSSLFWPVFGEYRDGAIAFDRYREEDFFKEEVESRDLDVSEIEEADDEHLSRFSLPELKRLFFLKVIRFKNGLALIPKMSHVAGDGYSYFFFLSYLAALTRPAIIPFRPSLMSLALRPHHGRTVLRDFSFRGITLEPPAREGTYRTESQMIPGQDVQATIQEVASSTGLRISRNDVLSAIAAKRIVKTGAAPATGDFRLTIPIDVRGKVREYGRGYFGNGIMFHSLTFKKERLEEATIQEIAVEIRKSMPFVSKETYIDFLRGLEAMLVQGRRDEFRPYDPEQGCLVTNLSKMPVERLDFGTGSPRAAVPLIAAKNSAGILAKGENYVLRFSS